MSRFLLLNFKDFGLNQDITQTIQSQTLACICCLDSKVPLINLSTCKHELYLESFYKSVFEPTKKAVCFDCHNMLKRIEAFRQQVLQSFECLEAEKTTMPAQNKNKLEKNKNIYNLTHKKTVNIYLPPAKYIPDKWPLPGYGRPPMNRSEVKMESTEPAFPVVKIKAEPIESGTVEIEIEQEKPKVKPPEETEAEAPEKAETLVRTVTLTKEELVLERLKLAQSPSYLKLPYRCESCVVGFTYEENIRDHMKRKHGPKVGSVTCDICLAVLHPPGSLNAHMFRHLTRYECVKCDKRYPSYDDTLHHYKKDHGNSSLRCPECHYTADTPQKFRKHKRLHHKRFTCADCGVVLATRPSLTRHMAVLHNKRLYRCVHCSITYTDVTQFVTHMRRHGAAAARAACAPCGVQFKAWHAYNAHVLYSTAHQAERRKISCTHCGMKFATATHLRMHVQFSDHPKQTFQCPDCPKQFAVEAEMKQHRNIHKKQRLKSTDRICDYCGRVYTSREHLIRHIETHLQKRQKAKEMRSKYYKKKINTVVYSLFYLLSISKAHNTLSYVHMERALMALGVCVLLSS